MFMLEERCFFVIPAQAGIQVLICGVPTLWIPAFAGMTRRRRAWRRGRVVGGGGGWGGGVGMAGMAGMVGMVGMVGVRVWWGLTTASGLCRPRFLPGIRRSLTLSSPLSTRLITTLEPCHPRAGGDLCSLETV